VPFLRVLEADLVITEHAIVLPLRPLRQGGSSGSRGRDVLGLDVETLTSLFHSSLAGKAFPFLIDLLVLS
jgi:hypothetical protein